MSESDSGSNERITKSVDFSNPDNGGVSLIRADARRLPIPTEYVQCVVTSPPYWGLRSYGTPPQIWGGEAGCEHEWGGGLRHLGGAGIQGATSQLNRNRPRECSKHREKQRDAGAFCRHCGAWRGDLGLEPSPDLYVQHLVEVFREVRRVLREDGVCWLNLGDSYAGASGSPQPHRDSSGGIGNKGTRGVQGYSAAGGGFHRPSALGNLKPKDLVGIPWRVAFALQADGWWLRSDIIWAKGVSFRPDFSGSCMPESVRDRPTRGHEYVFLLTKSQKYFYDYKAVQEDGTYPAGTRAAKGSGTREGNRRGGLIKQNEMPPPDYAVYSGKRNLRSVWAINPHPFKEAHFATFPPALVEPMVKAGSAHWKVDHSRSVVLDPFCGSGTVGIVCARLGRYFIGCDLKEAYIHMARRRIDEEWERRRLGASDALLR